MKMICLLMEFVLEGGQGSTRRRRWRWNCLLFLFFLQWKGPFVVVVLFFLLLGVILIVVVDLVSSILVAAVFDSFFDMRIVHFKKIKNPLNNDGKFLPHVRCQTFASQKGTQGRIVVVVVAVLVWSIRSTSSRLQDKDDIGQLLNEKVTKGIRMILMRMLIVQ